jgi:hypothetical protein
MDKQVQERINQIDYNKFIKLMVRMRIEANS